MGFIKVGKVKEEKIIRDIHRQLFKETMPIANYDELIKNEKTNFKTTTFSKKSS